MANKTGLKRASHWHDTTARKFCLIWRARVMEKLVTLCVGCVAMRVRWNSACHVLAKIFENVQKFIFPQWHDLSWRNILWSAHAWHWVSRISWIIRNVTGGTTWRKPWVTLPSWQTSCGATKMARLGTSYCTALARSVQGSLMHCSKRLGRSLTAEIAVRHSLLGWVAWQASSLSAYGLPVTLELWSGCVFQYNFSPTCS